MAADASPVWSQLVEVDKLEILAVVDNETDGISSPCTCCDSQAGATGSVYTSEFTALTQAFLDGKLEERDYRKNLVASHGLSLLLVAEKDGVRHTLLLDGGPLPEIWEMNAKKADIDTGAIEAVVASHWHVDHTGGLSAVAQHVGPARTTAEAADCIFDMHPKRPHRRGNRHPNGRSVPINRDVLLSELSLPGCRVELHSEPHTLLDHFFYVSGAIPRVTPYEKGLPSHVTQWEEGGSWESDPLIMDERYLAVNVRGKGAVVFSSCSHAGIVNVLKDVKRVSSDGHIFGVVGGLHLSGRDCEPIIKDTVSDLVKLEPGVILGGHCTGWRAKAALVQAFPDSFQTCVVGGRYVFQATDRGGEPAAKRSKAA